MKVDYAIIGGGIAGLAAANRLCDLGASPLLIEAGDYTTQKVCGEFLSPECLDLLKKWDIEPRYSVKRISFRTAHSHFEFSLPQPAKNMPRSLLDTHLVDRGRTKGTTILTNTKVIDLKHGTPHVLATSTGESIHVKNLLIATGRLQKAKPKFQYVGIKSHLKGKLEDETLMMFCFSGAYLGVSQVDDETLNVAFLAKINLVEKVGSPETLLMQFASQNPELKQILTNPNWISAKIPNFGIPQTPNWPNCYFIGDAAGTIPPICGGGLAMAITSGTMAADYAIHNEATGFKNAWIKSYRKPIWLGKILHELMMRPFFTNRLINLCYLLPNLSSQLYSNTR